MSGVSTLETGMYAEPTGSAAFEFQDYNQRVVVAVWILLVVIIGTFGNILTIVAVYLSTKLRLPVFVFVVNMSVADLLTCLVYPWDVVALLGKDGLPVGEWVCSVATVIKFTSIGCSVCSLASISLNRVLLIWRPTAYLRLHRSRNVVIAWLVIIWLFSLLVLLIPPLADVGAVGFNQPYHFCGSKSTHPLFELYNFIRVVAFFPISLLLVIISFIAICISQRRPRSRSREQPVNEMVHLETNNLDESVVSPQSSVPDAMSEQQAAFSVTFLFVIVGFVVCLTPYAVLIFLDINEVIPYANVLLYTNSCINPIIYAITNRDFLTSFLDILHRRKRPADIPS